MSQTALVGASGIDRSTLAEVLKLMIDRGMLFKHRTEADQRTNSLFLTDKGLGVLESAFDNVERIQEKILEPLQPEGRDLAMGILTALAADRQNPKEGL